MLQNGDVDGSEEMRPQELTFTKAFRHVHETPRRSAVGFRNERYIKIGRGTEHMQERPQSEAPVAVLFQSEIDAHVLYPSIKRRCF